MNSTQPNPTCCYVQRDEKHKLPHTALRHGTACIYHLILIRKYAMKHLAILGSTGSIGQNALSVVETHSDEFVVAGLAANTSVDRIEQQVRQFRPRLVASKTQITADSVCT